MEGCLANLAGTHMGRFSKVPFTLHFYIKNINPLFAIFYTNNNILSILSIIGNSIVLCSRRIIYLHQI